MTSGRCSNVQKKTTKSQHKSKKADLVDSSFSKGGDDATPPRFGNDVRSLTDYEDKGDKTRRPVHVRVAARQGESVEQMLRRFNFAVTKTNIIQQLKDLQYYEKPSKRRQRELKLRTQQIRRYER